MRIKFLLVSLLSFALAQAPVMMARDVYNPGITSTTLVGVYAGVLVPISDTVLIPGATDFGSNSLGLFTLSLPQTGLGTGTAVIFSNGNTFTGTIQAIINPDPSSPGILGILNATFNYNLLTTSTAADGTVSVNTESLTASAQGAFDATAVGDSGSVGGYGLDLSGTSTINVDEGQVNQDQQPVLTEQITFDIEGFEQSVSVGNTTGA